MNYINVLMEHGEGSQELYDFITDPKFYQYGKIIFHIDKIFILYICD
jgi:hypothetical protein